MVFNLIYLFSKVAATGMGSSNLLVVPASIVQGVVLALCVTLETL